MIMKQQYTANGNHNGAVEYRNNTVGSKKMQRADIRTEVQCKRNKKLIKNKEKQQVKLNFVVPDNCCNSEAKNCINYSKYKL